MAEQDDSSGYSPPTIALPSLLSRPALRSVPQPKAQPSPPRSVKVPSPFTVAPASTTPPITEKPLNPVLGLIGYGESPMPMSPATSPPPLEVVAPPSPIEEDSDLVEPAAPLPHSSMTAKDALALDQGEETGKDSARANPPEESMHMSSRRSETLEAVDVAQLTGTLQATVQAITSLPPSPPTPCDPEVQRKIIKGLQKYGKGGLLNTLSGSRLFNNPYLLEKQAKFLKIDEKASMFPASTWDPAQLDSSCYYKQLAEAQRIATEQQQEKQSKRTQVPFTPATAAAVPIPLVPTMPVVPVPLMQNIATVPNFAGVNPFAFTQQTLYAYQVHAQNQQAQPSRVGKRPSRFDVTTRDQKRPKPDS
eukprot:c18335_g1_i1.p1 GENE.c18335_g1_i1~~c18335_g1_i1.p1  ORF type:complete len:363 (+),score=70.87 c18335_g1_i1:19-1107(+)